MLAYAEDELVSNVLKAVFAKDEKEIRNISLDRVCRYIDRFIKLYTIYDDGIGSWYEERLEELLHDIGHKQKSKGYFSLSTKYITFEELKNLLGRNIKKSLTKSKFSNYNAFDLLAYHRSKNVALGSYELYSDVTFSYVLYTDESVDRRLSEMLKFTNNSHSMIHYEEHDCIVVVWSVYVDTKMRRQGYGYQMLESFIKSVYGKNIKQVVIEATSDEMKKMLKKLEKAGFFKKSKKLFCGKNIVYNISIPKLVGYDQNLDNRTPISTER